MPNQAQVVNHIYPDSKNFDISKIIVPADLKNLVGRLKAVKRYNDRTYLKKNLVNDNTMLHTIRCVYRAKTVWHADKLLERIIWVHDIPEILVSDVVAMAKTDNQKFGEAVARDEFAAAKKLLSEDDINLFRNFEKAKNFLEDRGTAPKIHEALIAKVIDSLDGNLLFHYVFTKFLNFNSHNNLVHNNVFTHTFSQFIVYSKSIKAGRNIDTKIKNVCVFLLNEQLKTITGLYNKIDGRKIPSVMRLELEKIKNFV